MKTITNLTRVIDVTSEFSSMMTAIGNLHHFIAPVDEYFCPPPEKRCLWGKSWSVVTSDDTNVDSITATGIVPNGSVLEIHHKIPADKLEIIKSCMNRTEVSLDETPENMRSVSYCMQNPMEIDNYIAFYLKRVLWDGNTGVNFRKGYQYRDYAATLYKGGTWTARYKTPANWDSSWPDTRGASITYNSVIHEDEIVVLYEWEQL